MTMEIKVGDKVRVSKDAPRIYTQNCLNLSLHNTDFEVTNIDDGCANIQNKDGILTIAYVIPTKYLTKVNVEAKEPKFKVDDYVRILECTNPKCFKRAGRVISEDSMGNLFVEVFGIGYSWQPPTSIELCIETDIRFNFKYGDLVQSAIDDYNIYRVLYFDETQGCYIVEDADKVPRFRYKFKESELKPYTEPTELVQPKEQAEEVARIRQLEAELDEFRKAELDRVLHPEKYYTYEVTVDNVAMDWQRYEADLAKEIAVKLSKPNENKPGYVADYAVSVAKAVVENLKKK